MTVPCSILLDCPRGCLNYARLLPRIGIILQFLSVFVQILAAKGPFSADSRTGTGLTGFLPLAGCGIVADLLRTHLELSET